MRVKPKLQAIAVPSSHMGVAEKFMGIVKEYEDDAERAIMAAISDRRENAKHPMYREDDFARMYGIRDVCRKLRERFAGMMGLL